jgi:ribosome modulation factor
MDCDNTLVGRGEELMTASKDFTRAYEYGEQAAMRGLTRDVCPYRKHDLIAHWLRGWHAFHSSQPVTLTEEEKTAGRGNLEKLRAIVRTPSPATRGRAGVGAR